MKTPLPARSVPSVSAVKASAGTVARNPPRPPKRGRDRRNSPRASVAPRRAPSSRSQRPSAHPSAVSLVTWNAAAAKSRAGLLHSFYARMRYRRGAAARYLRRAKRPIKPAGDRRPNIRVTKKRRCAKARKSSATHSFFSRLPATLAAAFRAWEGSGPIRTCACRLAPASSLLPSALLHPRKVQARRFAGL